MDAHEITAVLSAEVSAAMETFSCLAKLSSSRGRNDEEYKSASDRLYLALERRREFVLRGTVPENLAVKTLKAGHSY